MKTMHFMIRPILGILLISTMVISCSKNDANTQAQTEQEKMAMVTTESDVEAEIISNDVFDNVMGVNAEVAAGGTGVFAGANPGSDGAIYGPMGIDSVAKCFTISVTNLDSTEVFPVRVVIDFGTGCTGKDGRIRTGKIITTYSKRLIYPGATATSTFQGYSVNGIAIEGTHVITNSSTQNGLAFSIEVAGKLSRQNGDFVEFSSDRTIAQSLGASTPFDIRDDAYSVNGSANGTTKRADKMIHWSTAITTPLVKKFGCRWIIQGTITHKIDGAKIAEFDYGSGTCDNQATLLVNGQARIITLY